VVATILELDDLPAQKLRPEKAADLNTIIVVCGATSKAPGIERIYQWATEIGVLVTAVVVCPGAVGVSVAKGLSVLRAHCDMLTITTDEEYLPTMLQWLGRAG
ncbi:MAG: hypothetical protein JKY99_00225, partial [Rhizobiales bacterium]|nr:hypothetical protein [Hyphomicrobiales bacterium]